MFPSQDHHDVLPPTDRGDERRQRVFDQFHSFPFSSDETFQQGLSGILAHQSTDQMGDNERSELILKTKVFYFNRVTGHSISHEDVQDRYTADSNCFHARSGNECSQTSLGTDHGEMRVLTFAELKSLIEQGKTDNIPNNKIIPDILNITPGRHFQRINCTVAEKALGTRKFIAIHIVDRTFTTLSTELRQRLSSTSVWEDIPHIPHTRIPK